MTHYANLNGDSGVAEYESGHDFIKVRFRNNLKVYVYDHSKPGPNHVDQMKRLAANGKGLATYITQNVNNNYARKK